MKNHDDLERENQALRNRLSRLSEASLHINESLDLDAVLQGSPGQRPVPYGRQLCPEHHFGRLRPRRGLPGLRPECR